jgi:phospholipase C
MDGASSIICYHQCVAHPEFKFVDNSKGIVDPYLELATQYGWANHMFQTNQGPSFPAHQYLFGATSAPTTKDDARGIFAADQTTRTEGCISAADVKVPFVTPAGENYRGIYPCFKHKTVADILPPGITWRYYTVNTASLAIWTAPLAIHHICKSSGPGGECTGTDFIDHVDLQPADALRDISDCKLQSLSWVVPTGQNSDHAILNDGGGPSWVASIVNAIGNSAACDDHSGYWNNTAILILWDDWGGWYDHVPPKIRHVVEGDYELGFRVPFIFVSAYTQSHLIINGRRDFGSIVRFIEHNFGVTPGTLGFADARSRKGLGRFYDLSRTPRQFTQITQRLPTSYFLNDRRQALDPDDD